MELDLRVFSRYVGYILQELEFKQIINKVDKDKADKDEEKRKAELAASEARERREEWMRAEGKL